MSPLFAGAYDQDALPCADRVKLQASFTKGLQWIVAHAVYKSSADRDHYLRARHEWAQDTHLLEQLDHVPTGYYLQHLSFADALLKGQAEPFLAHRRDGSAVAVSLLDSGKLGPLPLVIRLPSGQVVHLVKWPAQAPTASYSLSITDLVFPGLQTLLEFGVARLVEIKEE